MPYNCFHMCIALYICIIVFIYITDSEEDFLSSSTVVLSVDANQPITKKKRQPTPFEKESSLEEDQERGDCLGQP